MVPFQNADCRATFQTLGSQAGELEPGVFIRSPGDSDARCVKVSGPRLPPWGPALLAVPLTPSSPTSPEHL